MQRRRPRLSTRRTSFIALLSLVGVTGCSNDSRLRDVLVGAPPTTAVPAPMEANATIEWVIDGDTVDVLIDGEQERVRLIGIDTPEIAHNASGSRPASTADCFGDEAHEFTRSLLPVGTPVRLERDVVGRDDYGRVLAYVYRAADGIFVNYEIVRQGYAQPLTIPPNVTFSDLMVDAARRAESDDVGLWSSCG